MAGSRTTRARGGFTLMEMVVVIAVLGIASAILIPQLSTRDDLRAASAARLVTADLSYAQNAAITKQKKFYVRFSGQQYSVCDNTALTPVDHPMHPAINGGKYLVTFGDGAADGLDRDALGSVDFAGKNIIGFNELGAPFGFDGVTETPLTQFGTIIVQSGGISLTIQIEPFTGETSVH